MTIFPLNDPPLVSLPLIEFQEDSIFTFDLDTLVSDIDSDTSDISWSFAFPANMLAAIQKQFMAELDLSINNNEGIRMGDNDSLTIEIDSLTHITTISATPNLYGLEIAVMFTSLDDSGAGDSDSTTISVFPVNDPPLNVAPLPPAFLDEDDTLNYAISLWFAFVNDPDDPVEQLRPGA